VAFITLLERKILGYSQYRLGPNKVSAVGILQPISDAMKLFSNQNDGPFSRNYLLYLVSPIIRVLLILWLWSTSLTQSSYHEFNYSTLVILIILRFGVYPLLISGWSSNSKYALLGGLRGVAQTISYEISMALILFLFLIYINRYSVESVIFYSKYVSLLTVLPFIRLFWVISCLAETNRTPFDFSEGESELVSGFNIEYGSGGFAILFIAEYARIFFLRSLRRFFLWGIHPKIVLSQLLAVGLIFFWVWARSTLPRFRYDLLMGLAWKKILPLTLIFLEISIVKVLI